MNDLAKAAIRYAELGWRVFPLRPQRKEPAVKSGLLAATTDLDQVKAWWSRGSGKWNIGLVPPRSVIVIDIDPRHEGDKIWDMLVQAKGGLPDTFTVWSGRSDGGRHLYFKSPGGALTGARLKHLGIDLKTHRGYVLAPPSIHPETGIPYWVGRPKHPIADCPDWLTELIRKPPADPTESSWIPTQGADLFGEYADSIADTFCQNTRWAEILEPEGWTLHSGDGDSEDSRWRHPTATQAFSATVRDGRLYVYSPNTPFDQTEPEAPRGYSKFDAYALLVHDGDTSEAARVLRRQGGQLR